MRKWLCSLKIVEQHLVQEHEVTVEALVVSLVVMQDTPPRIHQSMHCLADNGRHTVCLQGLLQKACQLACKRQAIEQHLVYLLSLLLLEKDTSPRRQAGAHIVNDVS